VTKGVSGEGAQTASGPLRVTHVVFDLDGGGMETLVASMARRQAAPGAGVSVVSLSGRVGRVGSAVATVLDHYELPRQWPGLSMLLPLAVARAIRRTRPDVVHIHSGCWYKGAMGARLAGAQAVIYTEHGREHDDPALARWIDRRASRLTNIVVTVSDRLAAYMERRVGIDRRRIRTVQNGVDTDVYAPGPGATALREQLGIPQGTLVVGSIGRLEAVKAYGRLVDAVAALNASGAVGRPVVGVVFGEGGERQPLERRARVGGDRPAFILPGWTTDAPVAHRLFDVFVLSSTSEGASVSLMESLATGVTPVVMDVGANAEIVGPDLASQVVPADNEDALRATLLATLTDQGHRQRLGKLGRQRVVEHYSLAAMVHSYQRVYREALRARRRFGTAPRQPSSFSAPDGTVS
jgi:glycosyltransferase involved in cell wall biosynthesis